MKKTVTVALLVSAALLPWIIHQRQEEQALQVKCDDLREAMRGTGPAERVRAGGRNSSSRFSESSEEAVFGDGRINWKRYPEVMLAGELIGIRDALDQMLIERRLREMTVAELLAALEESRGLVLSLSERNQVDGLFIWMLKEKDPVAALNQFKGELNGRYRYELGIAYEALAKDDLAEAAKWLDQQAEEGRMDLRSLKGEDYVRSEYERVLFEQMFAADIEAASARLAGMHEELRVKSLVNADTTRLDREQTQAMARVVKEHLPESAQAKVFSHYARDHIAATGLSMVSEFLDRIDPTPEIASQCVGSVVTKSLSRGHKTKLGDLNGLRDWASGHLTENIDSAVGAGVGNALFGHGSPDSTDVILDYYAAHGSDEFLAAVIRNAYLLPEAQAERMLQAIPERDRRREIRELYEQR